MSDDDQREALKSAFVAGCCAVLTWTNSGMPQDDLNKEGYDYADSILTGNEALIAAPPPAAVREEVDDATVERLREFAKMIELFGSDDSTSPCLFFKGRRLRAGDLRAALKVLEG